MFIHNGEKQRAMTRSMIMVRTSCPSRICRREGTSCTLLSADFETERNKKTYLHSAKANHLQPWHDKEQKSCGVRQTIIHGVNGYGVWWLVNCGYSESTDILGTLSEEQRETNISVPSDRRHHACNGSILFLLLRASISMAIKRNLPKHHGSERIAPQGCEFVSVRGKSIRVDLLRAMSFSDHPFLRP